MLQNERHQKIIDRLNEGKTVRVSELSESLGVSAATIRRDLVRLEGVGQLQRTHGGAVRAAKPPASLTGPVRSSENQDAKERIGVTAASLIQDGEAVFIGAGTTTMAVARHLCGRKNLTVITNALNVINLLACEEGISLVSTGGLLRAAELSFLGHVAVQSLHELRPHKVILGFRAISVENGLTSDYLPEVSTDRAILESGSEIIAVVDHTKIGKVAPGFIAPITILDKLITDAQVPPEAVEKLREKAIEVILC